MRIITSVALSLAVMAMSVSCSQGVPVTDYGVIPCPHEIKNADGTFAISGNVKIVYPSDNEAMQNNATFLAGYLKNATGSDFVTEQGGEEMANGNIYLEIDTCLSAPESYKISITPENITVAGADAAGVFYGIQTLRKSIPEGKGNPVMGCVEINDSPRFGYRGVHFDVCRHFFSVDEVKEFIEMMALHNMNRLHWHITDDQGWRVEMKKYPELTSIGSNRKETVIGHNTGRYDGTPYGGFYTQEQIREIVDYAAKHYITVIPEIDIPGHMQAALAAYPHLGCTGGPYDVWTMWGISDDVLCAGNDKVLAFLDDVLAEIIALFPSEYIHVGGDECPKVRWEKCPKCQAKARALGFKDDERHSKEDYLQSYVINHCIDFLAANNRKAIGWDEILEGNLNPSATVMSWRGEKGGIEAARKNHNVIMVPNNYLYFDYYQTTDLENEPEAIGGYVPLEMVYSYEPYSDALSEAERSYIIGVQANHWTEYMKTFSHVQYMAFPRWSALSEIQWCKNKGDYESFLRRLPRMLQQYDALGYNYAKHVFNINTKHTVDTINNVVEIEASTFDDAPIYYTTDGSEPTDKSNVWQGKIQIDGNCTLKAVALRNNYNSKVLTEDFVFNKATCRPITANLPVCEKYSYDGILTLVDGLKGGNNYKTGSWIGFYGNNLNVTVDLVEQQPVESVEFNTCVLVGDWIFDARSIAVSVSNDGRNFETVVDEKYPAMAENDENGVRNHKVVLPSGTKARYITVEVSPEHTIPDWHYGKGKPGFLFVDEISVN